jgi:hypothetical protein
MVNLPIPNALIVAICITAVVLMYLLLKPADFKKQFSKSVLIDINVRIK